MNTKSTYSVTDALNNVARLDQSYWQALVSNGTPNLEILSGPGRPKPVRHDNVRHVLSFVRTQYDWIVTDLGRGLSAGSLAALDGIDDTYLLTTLEVPALHYAKRVIETLLDTGYRRDRLHVVLNRAPKRSDITLQDLEGILGMPVWSVIPNDYLALQECAADRKLLSPNSYLGRHLTVLSQKIAGVEAPPKKKFSLFG
jgi:pilus assembly protein CpaE